MMPSKLKASNYKFMLADAAFQSINYCAMQHKLIAIFISNTGVYVLGVNVSTHLLRRCSISWS